MHTHPSVSNRLAVCSWSLQPETPEILLGHLQSFGISAVQIALDPIREHPSAWASYGKLCSQAGIRQVSGMMVTVGEDYSTMESIKATGGVVPDATWPENLAHFKENIQVAKDLGLSLVTFHAGFLPHEPSDPGFDKLMARIREIGELFGEHGLDLGFETGQETATTLKAFLDQLGLPNVGVNFDPANMILYDKGDPIDALKTLAPYLKQCHIKDATHTTQPGNWGEEVRAGTGEVDWKAFFQTLDQLGYKGDFAIEREAGESRVEDILAAKEYVCSLLS
ncbi:MAG: sugar phosphate isomerase/epimerase [Verrucomicrobiota bacterium]|nr:sugar phosphate isomerase/epimerase [Verrucomicrobiota bacterium]